jgi:hypothetical protein
VKEEEIMTRLWMSLALSLGLAVPALAWAEGGEHAMGEGFAGSSQVSARKELGEVDLYLKDALNNARLLFQITDRSQGPLSGAHAREQVVNIDRALANIDKHVAQLRSQPRAFDATKIDLVSRDLDQARSQLATLKSLIQTRRQNIHEAAAELARTLERADDDFGQLASSGGIGRVDQIRVTTVKQPVRGSDLDDLDITKPKWERIPGIDPVEPEHQESDSSPERGAYPRY